MTLKLSKNDRYMVNLVRSDEQKLKKKLEEVREAQNTGLNNLEKKIIEEIDKERKRINNLLDKVEKVILTANTHVVKVLEKIDLLDNIVDEEKIEEQPVGRIWYGLDAINKIALLISTESGIRNFAWEAASYAFLIPSVFERALNVDSTGYLLNEPITDVSQYHSIVDSVVDLIPQCESFVDEWDDYVPKVKEVWIELILPEIYGGVDPYWEDDDYLSVEYIQVWLEDRSVSQIYEDATRIIYEGKIQSAGL